MATQQHPAFDPTQLPPDLLRETVRQRDKSVPAPARGWKGEIGQLCSNAQLEARTWVLRGSSKGKTVLVSKLEEAKNGVESRCQILRNMSTAGHTLRGDAAVLMQNAAFLQTAFQKM